jgi:crossover junction endodeoxyribonuclease RuvC
MTVFGIDPGASGAIAVVSGRQLIDVLDMPHHDGVVSAPLLADFVLEHYDGQAEAWLEAVHAMPKQGVSSSFKFGDAFGTVKGVMGALRIPLHLITPAKWKRAAGLSADKSASRRRACELWPDHSDLFARVKDDGRAEAALLAELGRQASNR